MAVQNDILLSKLDEFIRKYYKNQLLKGAIYSTGIWLTAFLSLVVLNYFGNFESNIRTVLFFVFLGLTLAVVSYYIVIPLLRMYKIGKVISYEESASIIGKHFSNVQDKLLNALQLRKSEGMILSNELLLAGIEQKMAELKPVPFNAAIDIRENLKYLKYVGPVLFLFLTTYIIWPHIINKGTERLVNYQAYYAKELPFQFVIEDQKLIALQTQDFDLNLKIEGSEIPNEVFISINDIEYKLEKLDKIHFSYKFKNLQTNTNFKFNASGVESQLYELKVLPKPSIIKLEAQLIFPTYLNRPNTVVSNASDLQIPQGTIINWHFNTENTEVLALRFSDTTVRLNPEAGENFSFKRRFLQSNSYQLIASNSSVKNGIDSAAYQLMVLPDQYPQITLNQNTDSLSPSNIYLGGTISDDYGFRNMNFICNIYTTDSLKQAKTETIIKPISIEKDKPSQTYFYPLNTAEFQLKPGDKLEYYFEVYDNDGVNGSKSTRSNINTIKAPDKSEISENISKNNQEIKKDLEESIKKAKQLQKDVDELSKKLNDKNTVDYNEKKKLEDILKKQQNLKDKINQIKQENKQNNEMQNQFSEQDQSILEKQEELEKLFDEVMTPEMKKLFDELQKMMDKLNKNQLQEKLEEIKLSNKDLEKELDRNLELFKQLEVQQKMNEALEKLEELKNKQEELQKETENSTKKDDPSKLNEKQNDISKEFDQLKKDLKELEKKNNALEEPSQMPKTDEKQNEISNEMKKSSESLDNNKKNDAAKSQKEAAKKMEEMMEEMDAAMQSNESQQDGENLEAIRQILENLLNLSFGQEDLMGQLKETKIDNPKYLGIPQQQKKLKDDSKIIEDSLLALSKRTPQISSIVNREISAINDNMKKTIKLLSDRNTSESQMRMQSSMTSINNLALLLNEALEQMQNQMKSKKSGKSGSCKKPGSGKGNSPSNKPSIPNMRKMQEQLNKQLQDLKKALEQGQKPGDKPGEKPGKKPGEKPGQGMGGKQGKSGLGMPGSSEQFAKMAAQQEAIRRQLQQLMDKMKQGGANPGGDMLDLMEQTEKELVNKHISQDMIKRQNDILTKLLESEKAEREREWDEKRKSKEAKDYNLSNPSQFLEYKRLKEKELELINTFPPNLTPFYKDRVNQYFNNINKQ